MAMICRCVVLWIACFPGFVIGTVSITFDPSKAPLSDGIDISCELTGSSSTSVTWNFRSTSTSCGLGFCAPDPSPHTYSMNGNVFNLTLASVTTGDCISYSCQDTNDATDITSNDLYVAYFDKNNVTTTEPGANTDGPISATTGCVLSATDLTVTWYKIENGIETDFTSDRPSPVNSTARSTCTRTCHTEEDEKVTSGFTHTEYNGSDYVEVEYKLTISHSSYTGSADQFTWTSAKYRLKASSSMSTTPTTSTSTTPSTAVTSTSTTPTSTTTTSVSKSTTTTLTTASATAISTMLSTSSTTKAKSETTTGSADSSSSETVVIIVASVVGGLFVVGIVITIILMLLSQRKRRKHVSKGIHTYEENRNNKKFQRSKFPSPLGHSNDGYTFNGMSSGCQFKQNPLLVRQFNRPVTFQYQPRNGNYSQNPYSIRYIYPGFTDGDQYSGRYAGQDRRVNEAPNYYSSYSLRPLYYNHPPNPQRSNSRVPVRETLHTDDQNYIVSNYSMYW